MATHSSILIWKIPWTEEPGRLQSMGLQRARHDWTHTLVFSISLSGTYHASWLNFPSSVHLYLIKVWSYHFLSSSLLSKDLTFETTSSASNCSKLFSLFHLPNIFPGQNEMSCYLMQMPLVFHCSLPLPKPRMPCLISACSNPTQLQGPAPPAGYNLFLA